MAFDLPIEADRPDDLGFLSSFVRAPVVGTIMWLFGGKEAKKLEDEERLDSVAEDATSSTSGEIEKIGQNCTMSSICREEKRPSCIGSDVSDDGSDGAEIDVCDEATKLRCGMSIDRYTQITSLGGRKQRDSISWSDESGQSLVEYHDESQSALHEPPSDAAVPAKSAMRRASSLTKSKTLSDMGSDTSLGYGPGIVMPSGGVAVGGKKGNGYISPQWGWYISTTPPTPEMYHNGQSKMMQAAGQGPSTTHQQFLPSNTVCSGNTNLPSAAFSSGLGHSRRRVPSLTTLEEAQYQQQIGLQRTCEHNGVESMGENMGWPSYPL